MKTLGVVIMLTLLLGWMWWFVMVPLPLLFPFFHWLLNGGS